MRTICRRLVLVVALLGTGCADDDDGAGTTTTETTTLATTTSEAPTTTAPAACPDATVPADAVDLAEATGDLDGDEQDDQLTSYHEGTTWHLHVALSTGGGVDTTVRTYEGAFVSVLGAADADGDARPELWAQTGAGASAAVLGLFRFQDCQLTQVTLGGSEPAEFPVGGSVGSTAGLECAAHIDPEADLTAYTASLVADDEYEVVATEYVLDGSRLAVGASESTTVRAGEDAFARATSFRCGDLSL